MTPGPVGKVAATPPRLERARKTEEGMRRSGPIPPNPGPHTQAQSAQSAQSALSAHAKALPALPWLNLGGARVYLGCAWDRGIDRARGSRHVRQLAGRRFWAEAFIRRQAPQ